MLISIKINPKIKYIGIRPGEKLHETMISYDDSLYTYEFDKYYKIIPNINNNPKYYKANAKRRVKDNFSYSSDKNNDWKSHKYLSNWIKNFPIIINAKSSFDWWDRFFFIKLILDTKNLFLNYALVRKKNKNKF